METIPITQSQARMQMSEALQKLKAGTGYPTAVALLHFPATAEANWYPMQPPVLTGDLRAHALWRQLHQRTVADLAQVQPSEGVEVMQAVPPEKLQNAQVVFSATQPPMIKIRMSVDPKDIPMPSTSPRKRKHPEGETAPPPNPLTTGASALNPNAIPFAKKMEEMAIDPTDE